MKAPLVMLAGNLGAGKTTFAKRLNERFGWWIGYESVSDNPYLDDFYANMRAWSFHLQVYFLGNRAELHRNAAEQTSGAVLDRSIYEDRHIFAEALSRQGYISQRDLAAYHKLYNLVVDSLPEPDLIIYLTASVPTLSQRIRQRAQPFDRDLSEDYLTMIDVMYREWIKSAPAKRILTIDSMSANFANDPSDTGAMTTIFQSVKDAIDC